MTPLLASVICSFNQEGIKLIMNTMILTTTWFQLIPKVQDTVFFWAMPYARFTLADPMPRLCPDAVGSANVNGLPTRNRPSGPHREAIGRSSGNIKHV